MANNYLQYIPKVDRGDINLVVIFLGWNLTVSNHKSETSPDSLELGFTADIQN